MTPPSEIYTLSLHDALPICPIHPFAVGRLASPQFELIGDAKFELLEKDRKSTRLNSSHRCISYAVFCLKKKKRFRRSSVIDAHVPDEHLVCIMHPANIGV